MLHKGKLQAALNLKRGQFNAFDDSFIDQLNAYRHALETLYTRYPSSAELEQQAPTRQYWCAICGCASHDGIRPLAGSCCTEQLPRSKNFLWH